MKGHAITSDAHRVAGNDPSGEAWAESFRRALADGGVPASDVGTVFGDARGTAAIDRAEAAAVTQVWEPGTVRLSNLSPYTGHVPSTSALMSAVCATETLRTGWSPRIPGLSEPLDGLRPYLDSAAEAVGKACVVTAANWGGTYVSLVLAPWQESAASEEAA
ncbi:hypothetical protein A8W25_16840 [Streptomyces sp. ERV7]|uniref:hypothetical protein n=1 Tax=Streptomyces sp. ERV7 TaxID=1322334 RepID=UPI0007F3C312|nr:hypothetical protein [Streptomyces sp. ERV7]OAR24119.1 hypothetical protein A8W25_16840 [Streptomyces sp. ERV7]